MDPEVHPTFYLEGQPYELAPDSPEMPPELALLAIEHTKRAYFHMYASYLGGEPLPEEGVVLTEPMWRQRATELVMGISVLTVLYEPHLSFFASAARKLGHVAGIF